MSAHVGDVAVAGVKTPQRVERDREGNYTARVWSTQAFSQLPDRHLSGTTHRGVVALRRL